MVSVTSLRFMESAVRPEGLGSPTSQHDGREFVSSLSFSTPNLASDIQQLLSPTKASANRPGPDTLAAVDEADILSTSQHTRDGQLKCIIICVRVYNKYIYICLFCELCHAPNMRNNRTQPCLYRCENEQEH